MAIFTRTWGLSGAKYTASNASTTAAVLDRLSTHQNLQVRMAVADNENTSLLTSMHLAKDANADLRYALAENHHVHRRTLDFLTKDINPFVADRAQKTLLRLKSEIAHLLH
jgi:hypothetical protein